MTRYYFYRRSCCCFSHIQTNVFSGQNLRKDLAGEKLELALLKIDSQILMLLRKTALITEACARIRYTNHGQDEPFCLELMRRPEGECWGESVGARLSINVTADAIVAQNARQRLVTSSQ